MAKRLTIMKRITCSVPPARKRGKAIRWTEYFDFHSASVGRNQRSVQGPCKAGRQSRHLLEMPLVNAIRTRLDERCRAEKANRLNISPIVSSVAGGGDRFVIAEMKGADWGGLTDVKA